MEERFKKLDNFLREQLNGAPEDHSWNVPDDATFEKAMRTVAAQKKKKRRGWILIPILIGSGLMVSEYYHHRQIESLQGKIANLEEKFSRKSSTTDPLFTISSNPQDVNTSSPATTTIEKREKNSLAAASETSSNTQLTQNPNTGVSPAPNNSSNPSTSNTQSLNKLDKKSSQPKSTPTTGASKLPLEMTSNTDLTKANGLSNNAGSDQPLSVDPSQNIVANSFISGESKTVNTPKTDVAGMTYTDSWMTIPIATLELNQLETLESSPFFMPSIAATPTGSVQKTSLPVYAMHYGLLLGGNQSWLTMTNIPSLPDAILYNYDNSQPGFSMKGFVNKPVSPKFSMQAGLGYDVYRNKSILEDQFLFDAGSVTMMPNGESMYQTDYNVINPIGEYEMQLEFRAIDQMHHNDTIIEYTNIEQVMLSVMLDLGIHYDVLTLNHVKISLGTGFGLGYMAGLKNEFNVSTYYNGILQESQMETPDHTDSG